MIKLVSQRKLDLKDEDSSITNSAMRFSVDDDDPVTWWNVPHLKEKYGAGNKKGKTQRKCEVCHRDTVLLYMYAGYFKCQHRQSELLLFKQYCSDCYKILVLTYALIKDE
jgi:hypothetical protein